MFITYKEYKDMGGGLDETAFNLYAYEAERKIITATHGRAKTATEAIKRCIVRLAGILAKSDIAADKVTSFSNDGVSQSIKDVSAADYAAGADSIVREYLSNEVDENGVPLLYLGVDADD